MGAQKHLLVDGWNVIHRSNAMKALLLHSDEAAARCALAALLAPIHDALGMRVTIVYDGRGDEIKIARLGRHLTFSEVYTPSCLSADELIEQVCASSKEPESLAVASDDNMVRLTASSFGAETLSVETLFGMGESSSSQISTSAKTNARHNDSAWRSANSTNPFSALDELAAELKALEALVSKRREEEKVLKRTQKKAAQAASQEDAPGFAELLDGKKSSEGKRPKLGMSKLKKTDGKKRSLKSLDELKKSLFKKKP